MFDYPDVFEDFYSHYGVSQSDFATTWASTGNHAYAAALQGHVGDVVWYERTLDAELSGPIRHAGGFQVRFARSSALHRRLWRAFYLGRHSWRLRSAYGLYATVATYAAPLSLSLSGALMADAPDAFFVQDYASGVFDLLVALGRLTGRPVVAYHSGSQPEDPQARTVRRLALRRADLLLVPGAEERRRLTEDLGVSPARVRRVLTPIDTRAYRPVGREAGCRSSGLDPRRRRLLFLGRLEDPVKRVGSIMEAFAAVADRHPDTDLVVAGSGPDEEALGARARLLAPGRISLLGWVGGEREKVALYASCDALVMASRREGLPTVVCEAMACGVPVLSTEVGAVSELVEAGRTGDLVPAGDEDLPGALAGAMDRFLSRPDASSMGERARATAVEQLSLDRVGGQLADYFREVLTRSRHPGPAGPQVGPSPAPPPAGR